MPKLILLALFAIFLHHLSAQNYSQIQIEPLTVNEHVRLIFYVNDTLYEKIDYRTSEKVNHENVTALLQKRKLVIDGSYEQYYSNGKMKYKVPYSNGQVDGVVHEFFNSGTVKIKSTWQNGQLHGLFQAFDSLGVVLTKTNFLQGRREGSELVYYSNALLQAKLNYREGLLHGRQKTYAHDGKLKHKFKYNMGREILPDNLTFGKFQDRQRLFKIPGEFNDIDNLLTQIILPEAEHPDSVCKIEMRLLVNDQGRVAEILNFGTTSAANQACLYKLVLQFPELQKARFNDMPIEYMLTLPLYFKNGEYLQVRKLKPHVFFGDEYGKNYWIAVSCLNRQVTNDRPALFKEIEVAEKSDRPITKPGEVFIITETMPEFPGGEKALKAYLQNELKYPVMAAERGIQGRVYVSFIIEPDGSISDVKLVRSVDSTIDSEAIRVIKRMPQWKPGTQKGIPVRVKYTVPVNFKLQQARGSRF